MILSIETSNRHASMAIYHDGSLHEYEMAEGQRQSSHLLPMVKENLEKLGGAPKDVEEFVLNIGPGSSTGLRMGIAMAQGWSAVFPKVKFYGVHLESMALEVLRDWNPDRQVAYLLADAFAGQVFIQKYVKASGVFEVEGEIQLLNRDALLSLDKNAAIVDDLGVLKSKIEWPESLLWYEGGFPLAKWVIQSKDHHGDGSSVDKMDVRYLKATSAELKWNERQGK